MNDNECFLFLSIVGGWIFFLQFLKGYDSCSPPGVALIRTRLWRRLFLFKHSSARVGGWRDGEEVGVEEVSVLFPRLFVGDRENTSPTDDTSFGLFRSTSYVREESVAWHMVDC